MNFRTWSSPPATEAVRRRLIAEFARSFARSVFLLSMRSEAHLAMLERLGKEAWLRCDECAHTVMVKPRDLADRHGLDMLTLLRRMRCTRCGARKGGCRPAPHDTQLI
jgi:DNA-directed RNA polymerase subunit RPC12/RpoP